MVGSFIEIVCWHWIVVAFVVLCNNFIYYWLRDPFLHFHGEWVSTLHVSKRCVDWWFSIRVCMYGMVPMCLISDMMSNFRELNCKLCVVTFVHKHGQFGAYIDTSRCLYSRSFGSVSVPSSFLAGLNCKQMTCIIIPFTYWCDLFFYVRIAHVINYVTQNGINYRLFERFVLSNHALRTMDC